MQPENPVLLSSGCDWITVSTVCPESSKRLVLRLVKLLGSELVLGNEKRPWANYGYEGFKCGQVEGGTRADGALVRLSGEVAHENWRKVLSVADNCSRFDVQATIRWPKLAHRMIATHYREALKMTKRKRHPFTATILKATDQSSTIYLGKRISERFGRIYNKGLESGSPEFYNAVRYELELKKDEARSAALHCGSSSDPEAAMMCELSRFLTDRLGCSPPLLEGLSTRVVLRRRSDAEKSLSWLGKDVRPTVQRLIKRGRINDVVTALGLEKHTVTPLDIESLVQSEVSEYEH